jgi:hypothetical protein
MSSRVPAGPETMCLNKDCYERRMSDLAKTDIDKALEVFEDYRKADRFRWAQDGNGDIDDLVPMGGPSQALEARSARMPPPSDMGPRRSRYGSPYDRGSFWYGGVSDRGSMMYDNDEYDEKFHGGGGGGGGGRYPPYAFEDENGDLFMITRRRGSLFSRLFGRR